MKPSILTKTFLLFLIWQHPAISTAAPNVNAAPSEKSATSTAQPAAADEDDDSIIRKPKETEAPTAKEFSKAEIQKACAKFNGKFVSIAGEIWRVESCKRHQVHDPDAIFKFSRANRFVEVDARDVAAIPVAASWDDIEGAKQRPCATFNGKYVTYSYTDVYYVDKCVKRLIPDYETLLAHRKEHGIRGTEIIALTAPEFYHLKQSRDVSSVVDKEFAKLLDGSAGVDIIPIDEACKGVEGKLVTFYSRMYRIEKCRKRELDAEVYTMKRHGQNIRTVELRPEQWISMPDGKPLKE